MKIRIFEGDTISEQTIGHYTITVQRSSDIITIEVRENDYLDFDVWNGVKDVIEERTGRVITIMAQGSSGSRENFYRTEGLLNMAMVSVENQLKGVL